MRAGVQVTPGRPYHAAEPPAANLRLSYAAAENSAQVVEGIHRLRAVLDEVTTG